jgi:hypothetical protein
MMKTPRTDLIGEPETNAKIYAVEISRTISTIVTVEADSAASAVERVNRTDFPLPPRDEWSGHKDWAYRATLYRPSAT